MDAALVTLPRTPTPAPANEAGDRSRRLAGEISQIAARLYAATYQMLTLIREFDEERHWERLGFLSCAHWLNVECGVGMNAAREKVRVAHALKNLPEISEAFRKGALSWSKVRAMTRVAAAHNEDYLLQIAHHGTAYHVERLVSTYRRCKRFEDTALAEKQYASREMTVRYDDDGSVVLKGRFPPEVGAMIVKAVERAMDDAEEAAGDSDDSTARDVSAETPGNSESRPRPPIAARRADALAALAESYLQTGPRAKSTADRYQVVVHVSAETLQSPVGGDAKYVSAETLRAAGGEDATGVSAETCASADDGMSELEDGHGVSAETSRRLACDAAIVGILDGADGEPLSIGRKRRSVPPAMRRALKARDRGCRFPGCTRTRFVDAHHVRHWADGGETRLDNLVELCRHHHRLVHEGGFGCERGKDGSLRFTNPQGETLANCATPLPPDTHPDLASWLDANVFDLDIDEHTCAAKWYAGDRMDWELGVFHLFACEKSAEDSRSRDDRESV